VIKEKGEKEEKEEKGEKVDELKEKITSGSGVGFGAGAGVASLGIRGGGIFSAGLGPPGRRGSSKLPSLDTSEESLSLSEPVTKQCDFIRKN